MKAGNVISYNFKIFHAPIARSSGFARTDICRLMLMVNEQLAPSGSDFLQEQEHKTADGHRAPYNVMTQGVRSE
jgi:hypothetical protein